VAALAAGAGRRFSGPGNGGRTLVRRRIALTLAATRPDLVAALVLVDPPLAWTAAWMHGSPIR